MTRKPIVETGPFAGGWANTVQGSSRVSNTFRTKAEAVARGRQMAMTRRTEHIIRNADGRVAQRKSYAQNPFPPRV